MFYIDHVNFSGRNIPPETENFFPATMLPRAPVVIGQFAQIGPPKVGLD